MPAVDHPPASAAAPLSIAPTAASSGLGRAWWTLSIGMAAYFVAMVHRMSLGVAGADAAARFDIPLGSLAIFTSVQLVLYLLMQVPAGLLADRFGPRRTLAIGLALMAVGELIFAVSTSMSTGILGRGLVGVGDALTFLNVLRLAHAWFPARMQTLLVALIGLAGSLGQLVSTVPLEAILTHLGWTPTFLLLGSVSAVLVIVPLVLIRDRPAHVPPPTAASHEPIVPTLVAAWRRPGTRHGFFVHLGCLAPFILLAAVWGIPFMEGSRGIDRSEAAGFLMIAALAFVISGPVAGLVIGDSGTRQRIASIVFPTATTLAWAVLLMWPGGTVPTGVLVGTMILTGIGGSGSMLAFELARRESPPVASGSAAALVNCGGFVGAVLGGLVIGALIGGDHQSAVQTQQAMLPVLACATIGLLGSAWFARRPSVPYGEG